MNLSPLQVFGRSCQQSSSGMLEQRREKIAQLMGSEIPGVKRADQADPFPWAGPSQDVPPAIAVYHRPPRLSNACHDGKSNSAYGGQDAMPCCGHSTIGGNDSAIRPKTKHIGA